MKSAKQILFPERVVRVRVGWRMVKTIVIRPFTIRQLFAIEAGQVDELELSTGLTLKELAKVGRWSPKALIELRQLIDTVNAWDIKEIVRRFETDEEKKDPADEWTKLFRASVELIQAGHRAGSIFEYSLEQYAFHLAEARRIHVRNRLQTKADFAQAATGAVATFSEKGAAANAKMIAEAIKAAIKLENPPS